MTTIKPIVNWNGSTSKSLLEGVSATVVALTAAKDDMMRCCPHGRDYQCSPEGDYERDRTEHFRRIDQLHELINTYIADADYLLRGDS